MPICSFSLSRRLFIRQQNFSFCALLTAHWWERPHTDPRALLRVSLEMMSALFKHQREEFEPP